MAVNDNPYEISSQGGTKFKLTGGTAAYVVEIVGGASLAGDMLVLAPVAGQTGKSLVIKDTTGATQFAIGADGTVSGVLSSKNNVAAILIDSAVTITAANKDYFITKVTAAAITIVDPTATTHDGVELTFIATTAAAHTLSNAAGSGFFSSGGASKDVATFGGAIGDRITIEAYQGKWYIKDSLNITLA